MLELHIQYECCFIWHAIFDIYQCWFDDILLSRYRNARLVAIGDNEIILIILEP